MRATLDTYVLVSHEERFSPPRIRLFLLGGCHELGEVAKWTLVAPDGGGTPVLRFARFYPFSMEGYKAAQAAANKLKTESMPTAVAFTARVLVMGSPAAPDEVVEAWRLEGTQPVDIKRYPFQ